MTSYKKDGDFLICINGEEKRYNIKNLIELKKGIISFLESSTNIDKDHIKEYASIKISQEEELKKINNLLNIYDNL